MRDIVKKMETEWNGLDYSYDQDLKRYLCRITGKNCISFAEAMIDALPTEKSGKELIPQNYRSWLNREMLNTVCSYNGLRRTTGNR